MIRRHIRFSSVRQRGSIKTWKDKLVNSPAFLLGNGPSLNDIDLNALSPYFTIGINRAFYLFDPTILLWQDAELWYSERKQILKLSAIKVCKNTADPQNRFFHYKLENGSYKLPESPHVLYGRGSTGPLAFQLAFALGCNPIILLGYDCKHRGIDTDFYGRNRHHQAHTMLNCRKGLEWMKTTPSQKTIINCSDNDYFPKISFTDFLPTLGNSYKQQRSYWAGLFS